MDTATARPFSELCPATIIIIIVITTFIVIVIKFANFGSKSNLKLSTCWL